MFRAEIAQQLKAAMHAHRIKTQAEAARALNITRQAFSQYLREKTTPQAEILARACSLWHLTLTYRAAEFGGGAFGVRENKREPDVLQLDLFKEPLTFQNNHMLVCVERSQQAALQITIRMKKADLPARTSKTPRVAT
jgi:transcriptional regulator with XRE-family HTH domain